MLLFYAASFSFRWIYPPPLLELPPLSLQSIRWTMNHHNTFRHFYLFSIATSLRIRMLKIKESNRWRSNRMQLCERQPSNFPSSGRKLLVLMKNLQSFARILKKYLPDLLSGGFKFFTAKLLMGRPPPSEGR